MSYRDRLFAKIVKSPSVADKYLYSKFRNRVVSEQCESKTEYYQNYFEKHKTNMKMLWTSIKSIISLKAKHQLSHISHLKSNDSRVTDPAEMANLVNHYFVNVGSNIDKKIPRTKKSPLDCLKRKFQTLCFYHLLPLRK